MTLKVLSEEDKQEIREAMARWARAAGATAKRDPRFREVLARTPFYGLAMAEPVTSEIQGDNADIQERMSK